MPILDCSISLQSAGRKSSALALETLEARITPSDFMWSPTIVKGRLGDTWSAPTNWDLKDSNGKYEPQFTAVPGAGDSVIFQDNPGVSYCFVDVAGGVTVKSLKCSGGYGLVLTNSLTVDGGQLSRFAYMSIRADFRNNPSARGVLTLTNGADLDWRRGYFDSIDVNIVNSSSMSVYALDHADNGGATYNHDMENTRININSGSTLKWLNGDVKVDNLRGNSEVRIGSGCRFEITGGGSWGMSASASPAYFKVTNYGSVLLNANGTATIVGDYTTSNLTQLDLGILHIQGKAVQTYGMFALRSNTTIKVSGPESALRIQRGTIDGQGTVDANLTLGFDPLIYPPGQRQTNAMISPSNGGTDASIGTITIVAAFQIFDGTMAIDVNANGLFDKVVVQGAYAALAGKLAVANVIEYQPRRTVSLTFLTAPSITGDFASKLCGTTNWSNPVTFESFVWDYIKTNNSYSFASVAAGAKNKQP